jgi:cytochrome P450
VGRHVVAPYAIGDTVVPAGDLIFFMTGAANRDPVVFAEPDRFDITRPNARDNKPCAGGCPQLHQGAFAHPSTTNEHHRLVEPITVARSLARNVALSCNRD